MDNEVKNGVNKGIKQTDLETRWARRSWMGGVELIYTILSSQNEVNKINIYYLPI